MLPTKWAVSPWSSIAKSCAQSTQATQVPLVSQMSDSETSADCEKWMFVLRRQMIGKRNGAAAEKRFAVPLLGRCGLGHPFLDQGEKKPWHMRR